MKKNQSASKTIDNILLVSKRLFLEKGYEKTTTQAIVNETGLSKGTLFHHFASKEDILAAVLETHNAWIASEMKLWLAEMDCLSAKEKITQLFHRFYDDSQQTPLSKMAQVSRSPRLIIEDLRTWAQQISPLIAELICQGNQDGSLKADHPKETAELFNLLFCIWTDPVTLTCSPEELQQRLLFLQQTMKALGVDVVDDAFIDKTLKFSEELYQY